MEKNETKINLSVVATPEAAVPKFCTNVAIKKFSNGSIVMSFIYSDDNIQGNMIESILIDSSHAQKVIDTLKEALETKGDEIVENKK